MQYYKFMQRSLGNGSEYRLRYREPRGCVPDDCDYFVGIDTNEGESSFLDVYLVGKTRGWVALGLTKTANMVRRELYNIIHSRLQQ